MQQQTIVIAGASVLGAAFVWSVYRNVADFFAWLWQRVPAESDGVPDWANPDYAPPAFPVYAVHEYKPAKRTPCCVDCGGGRLNEVHTAAPGEWTPPKPAPSFDPSTIEDSGSEWAEFFNRQPGA